MTRVLHDAVRRLFPRVPRVTVAWTAASPIECGRTAPVRPVPWPAHDNKGDARSMSQSQSQSQPQSRARFPIRFMAGAPALRVVLAAAFALAVAACGGRAADSRLDVAPADRATAVTAPTDYHLGAGDKLKIVVFGHQDVSGEFVVDGSGNLSMPLVGRFRGGGLTVSELQDSLTKTLNEKYIVDPKISVEVLNYRPFFILGEVNRPGSYPYVAGIDVLQAVALGGGFTRRARTSSVTIIRDGKDGRTTISAEPEDSVLPGDTIEVERRLF